MGPCLVDVGDVVVVASVARRPRRQQSPGGRQQRGHRRGLGAAHATGGWGLCTPLGVRWLEIHHLLRAASGCHRGSADGGAIAAAIVDMVVVFV